ncbi:MAG: hypothetical protein K2H43_00685, partial [Clostridia bacterium]|nr:hypothetical protein [Clostridia bacterium]
MKKKVVALAGVLLAGTIVAMAGCSSSGSGSSGKISGNYKEADDETVAEALSNIDVENAFVDTSAKNWKYGLQLGGNVDITINASGNDGSSGKIAIKGSGDYKISLQKKTSALSGESMTVAGEGNMDGSFNVSGTGMQAMKASLKAKAYNDIESVYASVSGTIPNT